jgi:hypothetical protein
VPLAVASQASALDPTDRFDAATLVDGPAPTTHVLPGASPDLPPGEDGWPAEWSEQGWPAPPPRAPWPERLRRGLLLGAGALAAGAAVAAYPWPATAALLVMTWLLRSGSLAASAAGDRRRLRGRKWYDGVQFLVAAPWHLVRAIGGTVLLALWSLGLATAAALVCYAVAAGATATLAAAGTVFAASLWLGPGGSRVRSPLSRVVNPVSATPQHWAGAVLLVLLVALGIGIRLDTAGTSWAPADHQPLDGLSVPDHLPGLPGR